MSTIIGDRSSIAFIGFVDANQVRDSLVQYKTTKGIDIEIVSFWSQVAAWITGNLGKINTVSGGPIYIDKSKMQLAIEDVTDYKSAVKAMLASAMQKIDNQITSEINKILSETSDLKRLYEKFKKQMDGSLEELTQVEQEQLKEYGYESLIYMRMIGSGLSFWEIAQFDTSSELDQKQKSDADIVGLLRLLQLAKKEAQRNEYKSKANCILGVTKAFSGDCSEIDRKLKYLSEKFSERYPKESYVDFGILGKIRYQKPDFMLPGKSELDQFGQTIAAIQKNKVIDQDIVSTAVDILQNLSSHTGDEYRGSPMVSEEMKHRIKDLANTVS